MSASRFSLLAFALVVGAPSVQAQFATMSDPIRANGYLMPSKSIAEAVLAPWYKNVTPGAMNAQKTHYLVTERDGQTSLQSLGRPHVNLAGAQFDTKGQRERGVNARTFVGCKIVRLADKKETKLLIPPGTRISDVTWSPDGSRLAFLAHFDEGSYLYTADPQTGASSLLYAKPLKLTLETSYFWVEGGKSIIATTRPASMENPPKPADVASSPKVQASNDRPTSIRTYPSLLQSPEDIQLLEFFATSQLAKINVQTGNLTPVGKPTMIRNIDAGPDGRSFRVTIVQKPFNYTHPFSSFGSQEVLWDESGTVKSTISGRSASQNAAPAPAAGQAPPANFGKRLLSWRPDAKGLSFLQNEAPAEGASVTARRKDRVMQWVYPYGENDVKTIYTSETPITNVRYSEDADMLFVNTTVDGKDKLILVKDGKVTPLMDNPVADPSAPAERADFLMKANKNGVAVLRLTSDQKSAYLSGSRRTGEVVQPYIDKVELATAAKTRIFEGKADMYETASLVDDDGKQLLVSRQSSKLPADSYFVTTATKAELKLTANVDYVPDLTQAKKETFTVTRADGFKFQVKVTLPSWWTKGSRLPAFFWFYPNEFTSQEAYDRSKRPGNKHLFTPVSGANKAIFLREGYALVEPDCPIIGPAGRMNDEYVPQLRNNLTAVIDELDKQGLIDRNKLALGGHSYGAFSTVNAMVHTPYFKAGIAGDGCYNRTLTPFGFQTDSRPLWEARDTYLELSPLLHVERITGALLMYHGMEDQNIGTAPINSERMFAALESIGKESVLYMYPYEDHGQIAKETILDQWARWIAWLDKYVKHPHTPQFQFLRDPVTTPVGPGARTGGTGTRPAGRRGTGTTPPPPGQ